MNELITAYEAATERRRRTMFLLALDMAGGADELSRKRGRRAFLRGVGLGAVVGGIVWAALYGVCA